MDNFDFLNEKKIFTGIWKSKKSVPTNLGTWDIDNFNFSNEKLFLLKFTIRENNGFFENLKSNDQ